MSPIDKVIASIRRLEYMLKYDATQEMTIKYLKWKINEKKKELKALKEDLR